MNEIKCQKIFERFQALNHSPTTELKFSSTFELLIAVILSAHTTDVSVNKATAKLFPIANTPEKILALGGERLKTYIQSIGLYNSKTKHILQTCQILVDQFHSQVPKDRTALESLPGVGRKTANVILNTAFEESTIAVDTHVFRVAKRIGLAQGATPKKVEQELLNIIPSEYQHHAHHWLVLHGRYICVARKPKCWECPINDLCEYPLKS